MTDLVGLTERPLTDNLSMPIAASTTAPAGSAAASPQTETVIPFAMSCIGGQLAQSENRRVQGILKSVEHAIRAVRGHRVLSEVIGADREEIDFGSDRISHQRHRGNLDHHTNRRHLVGNAFIGELLSHIQDLCAYFTDLRDMGDHGQHHRNITVN